MNNTLTILTPTYNHAENLKTLYLSLVNQTNKNFTWFIIDDGSEDNTENTVALFIKENKLDIVYAKKENGGKHTAINEAMKKIEAPLVLILDSDEKLLERAVEAIYDIHAKYENKGGICGYSFLRLKHDGSFMHKNQMTEAEAVSTYTQFRINRGFVGDMREVWYRLNLLEYPFDVFPGEKFLGEDTVWIKMAEKYQMVFTDIPISISEYHKDGLTKNRRKHNINSPKGCVKRATVFLEADIKLRYKIKAILQYIVYGRFASYGIRDAYKQCPEKLLFIIFYPFALLIYFYWNSKFKE